MNKSHTGTEGKGKKFKKFIPIIAMLMIAVIFSVVVHKSGEPLSVKTILRYTPQNTVLAVIILLLFFGLKSLTIVFPISILYLASGILFSPLPAILVSAAGLAITISVPYWLGRYSGEDLVQKICTRYPKAAQIAEYQEENSFFACFITRIVGFLPGDIVSMYFGACRTNFRLYLTAGILGSMLSIITTTLLGTELNNPFSVTFMVVLLCRILVSVGCTAVNYLLNKKKQTK
ncbi:MAG: VTT domain-containing protein [Clostridia bacterium]|nr:VTT domain-containing protein [Clostridia bacterium]MDY5555347.1 VTT domain-containing protein [Blautia sp.]